MPTERLFIALTFPPSIRDLLAGLCQPLPGVTWTRADQLHVTLRFLGEVPTGQIESLIARLATVRVASFVLPIEGIGTFPPNRPPRIVWIGVGSGHPRLFQLRQRVDDALLASGIQLDVRTFHPHVTLARVTENAYVETSIPTGRLTRFEIARALEGPMLAVRAGARRT